MAKKLLIVESPSKAKTLQKHLGKDYSVRATVGHVRDLPKKELGVDVENGFEPKYVTIRGKGKVLKSLKTAAKTSESVLIATDPDREGEAIAYHISYLINGNNSRIYRVLFNEITDSGIKAGLDDLRQIDRNKVDAQQARRIMDRLVGYGVSPFLWKTLMRGLSAGRVQSVALRLLSERESEITDFEPLEYWMISAELKGQEGEVFTSELVRVDGEKPEIPDGKTGEDLATELRASEYTVSDVKKKEVKRQPAPPFTTSTLQQAAARRMRFSPRKTMAVAQQLYEGIEIGGGEQTGLITYMRTDSTRIADVAIQTVRKYIGDVFSSDYVSDSPRYFKRKKGAQDAHEAIRPTNVSVTPDSIKGKATPEQYNLYNLIWIRFVASQMASALFDQTTINVKAGDRFLLRTAGSVLKFDGFLRIYPDAKQEKEEQPPRKVNAGEQLDLIKIDPEQHFTKPPARFSESGLIKELDKLGIGRPSTYAQIITTLYQREYAVRENRRMQPTDLGMTVNRILVTSFPNIFNVEFTARMEDELDRIESGEYGWRQVLADFYNPFENTLTEVTGRAREIKESLQEKTGETCELCGRPMVIKWSRRGKFLSCSGFPECKNAKPLDGGKEAEPEPTGEKCEKCGGDMVVKHGRFGKFLACSNYPECKNTKPIPLGVQCPEDGGDLVSRRTRKGRTFYGCANYPDCKFATWERPIPVTCPSCEYPFMTEKRTKDGELVHRCPQCKGEVAPATAEGEAN